MKLKTAELELIRLARVCHLATSDKMGNAHCVPVSPVFGGKHIYFGSAKRGRKISNIRRNPSVALVFDDYSEAWSGRRGVMIQGEARIIERGRRFRKARRLLYEKYPQYRAGAVLKERDSVIVGIMPRRTFSWGL